MHWERMIALKNCSFVKILQILMLLLLSAYKTPASAKSNFELIYMKISCRTLDTNGVVKQFTCALSKTVKRSSFNVVVAFHRDLPNFQANLLITLPRERSDFVLLNFTHFNGCQLLSNEKQVPFLNLGMTAMARYSNLPHRCPLRKDVSYYMRGYRLELSMLPAFNFEANMKTFFQLVYNRRLLLEGYIRSRVQRRQQRKVAQ